MSNSPRFEFHGPLSDKIVQLKANIVSLKNDLFIQINIPDPCPTLQTLKINFLQYLLYKAESQLKELETQWSIQFENAKKTE